MKKSKSLYTSMERSEKILGFLYLVFQLTLLSPLLHRFNGILANPMNAGTLNFVYYLVNFLAVLWIFHGFLRDSLVAAWRDLWNLIQAVVLGFVAYWACGKVLDLIMDFVMPGFRNVNDSAIISMAQTGYLLTVIGVVVLVPLTEEVLYRGLIFRNLWQSSRVAAYLVSMAAFAAIHVLGYIGSESVTTLVLCFIQYLPAGLCLAWTYTKADNIIAPVLVHSLINAIAIGLVR